MSREFITEIWEIHRPYNFYILEGYDDCIIGYDFTNKKLIYAETLILEQLMCSMSFDNALSYYFDNIVEFAVDRIIISSTLGK